MGVNSLLSAALGAIALAVLTTAAQAGPSGLADGNDQSVGGSGLVEKLTSYSDRHYSGYHRPYKAIAGTATATMATVITAAAIMAIAGMATAITADIRAPATATGNGARGRPAPLGL
jgi:hypothetical protein